MSSIEKDFRVSEETLDFVISRLKSEGNMATFRAAAKIQKQRSLECH